MTPHTGGLFFQKHCLLQRSGGDGTIRMTSRLSVETRIMKKRHEQQIGLWDSDRRYPKPVSAPDVETRNAIESELQLLRQRLGAAQKKIETLSRDLERAKAKHRRERQALIAGITSKLHVLLLLTVLRKTSLKDTKAAIKPLKPTAGVSISTNTDVRRLGGTIGLSAKSSEAELETLLKAGAVKRTALGSLELGRFSADDKGRIVPLWHLDPGNQDHMLKIISG